MKSKDPKIQPWGAPEFMMYKWEVNPQNSIWGLPAVKIVTKAI